MAGNNSLELEINSLFQEGNSLDTICNEVIAKYDKSDVISPLEIESLCHFLSAAGRPNLLFKFLLKCLRKDSIGNFPWGSFVEACIKSGEDVSNELLELIETSLEESKDFENSAKSPTLINLIPELSVYISNKKTEFINERLQSKTKLIAQLNHNRIYQMNDQEEHTLQQLVKMFPHDIEAKLLHQAHLEKKADDILNRIRTPSSRTFSKKMFEIHSEEAQQFISDLSTHLNSLADRLNEDAPEQIYNLAMLALQFELFDLSLVLINKAPKTFASEWLKAEVLFESSRFLDLLKHIDEIESSSISTPEATYGAIYLKAQAYYGLGQKQIAIQLLESLSSKVSSYRSTDALLHEWKSS